MCEFRAVGGLNVKNGHLIKQERKRRNLSQKDLANLINVDRTTITRYENSQSVPYDALERIASTLESNRLRLEALGSVIPCFYLDRVDLHPLAVKEKGIEEMEEAVDNLKELDLINRRKPDDLTEDEKNDLKTKTIMALQDVNMCINHILISFSETYDIDLNEIEMQYKKKMAAKGYVSRSE